MEVAFQTYMKWHSSDYKAMFQMTSFVRLDFSVGWRAETIVSVFCCGLLAPAAGAAERAAAGDRRRGDRHDESGLAGRAWLGAV